ncbi:MAG: AMP-binding protein [Candidatus Schekmanbacteria bacterium]|nr:AMP-binding protein [Candidatus Schekmanbacteria bacterium]
MNAELLIVGRAREHASRCAIADAGGRFSYTELLAASERIASVLLGGAPDLAEQRVAYLAPPGFDWVAAQWGIWRAGGVAVPLATSHPPAELAFVLRDSGARATISHPTYSYLLRPLAGGLGIRHLELSAALSAAPRPLPDLHGDRRAQVFYTSGTSARPKGVVLTHRNIAAQVQSLTAAWEWTAADRILGVLPLHHVHGVINVLTCALWSGATCELVAKFDAAPVWDRLASAEITLFMAVPTVYALLISAWEQADGHTRARWSAGARTVRLMVSGSAALPVGVLRKWRELTGQVLLERYGMTEIGMALANPLHGPRTAGSVGTPLPGVDVRLVGDDGAAVPPGTPGEIEVRGETVFLEYLGNAAATAAAFRDRWFRTGDVAVLEEERYRILGRKSVDIIKTGGYKVSALEIEEVLRAHPEVRDCAVVAMPDPVWGERVAAAIVAAPGARPDADELQAWSRERLAPYKVPSRLTLVDELPRNALGKVQKNRVARLLSGSGDG